MTKKEQQQFQELKEEFDLYRALRWTASIETDVSVPESSYGNTEGLAKGFLFNDYLGGPRVERACSSSVGHAFGQDDRTTTQNPRRLYSTRLLALKALRYALEKKCAEKLLEIDRQIQKEESGGE